MIVEKVQDNETGGGDVSLRILDRVIDRIDEVANSTNRSRSDVIRRLIVYGLRAHYAEVSEPTSERLTEET